LCRARRHGCEKHPRYRYHYAAGARKSRNHRRSPSRQTLLSRSKRTPRINLSPIIRRTAVATARFSTRWRTLALRGSGGF
jgi:hypothetical protein